VRQNEGSVTGSAGAFEGGSFDSYGAVAANFLNSITPSALGFSDLFSVEWR
jgi:hypothetical protein